MKARGFTLLEMLVATVIMGIAVVSLLAAISTSMRNAARLTDYDRAALLARSKMDELLLAPRLPLNMEFAGPFDPVLLGGREGGWRARVTPFEMPPQAIPGAPALDRVELQVWWNAGDQPRTFRMNGYRTRVLTQQEVAAATGVGP
jgi:general secretion pathway protein I